MITAAELADKNHLNCDITTVYRMVKTRQIPHFRVGNQKTGDYRFDWEAVQEALKPPEKVDPWLNPRARRKVA